MKRWILAPIAAIFIIWLLSLPPETFSALSIWPLRRESILLSGVLAIVMMAWTMVLSLRLAWIERKLGGLDRVFQVHKWSGICSGIFVFIHWMLEIVPKELVGAGLMTAPVRGPRPVPVEGDLFPILKNAAVMIGEWTAYGLLALVLIALIRSIPYHWFRRLHKLLPVAFLAAAFHSVILMPAALWLTAGGIMTAIALVVGSSAAVLSLCGWIGRNRTIAGKVTHVQHHPNGFLEVTCALENALPDYLPGHFAFARFPGNLDPHPFSIISFNDETREIRFLIKPLGDDTRRLASTLKPGEAVSVEGPYGSFDFSTETETEAQIWIGGGVGIAPFLSRLEYMIRRQKQSEPKNIQMIYCTRDNDPMIPELEALCVQAGVRLRIFKRSREGALDLENLLGGTPSTLQTSVWFCGPASLGITLEKAWDKLSLPKDNFHRELFSMR